MSGGVLRGRPRGAAIVAAADNVRMTASAHRGTCLYPTNGHPYLGTPFMPYEESNNATSGICDTYEGDNDGALTCHKAGPDGPVSCIMMIS